MTLGEWIETLASLPADATVVMDCGKVPTKLCSWRGVYAELTLDSDTKAPDITVAQLLADAQSAVGKEFTGYKGGEYVMGRDTPVWADEWGDYESRMLLGARVSGDRVVLSTQPLPDEYRGY